MQRVLTDQQADEIRGLAAKGYQFTELAALYKVSNTTIEYVVHRIGAYRHKPSLSRL